MTTQDRLDHALALLGETSTRLGIILELTRHAIRTHDTIMIHRVASDADVAVGEGLELLDPSAGELSTDSVSGVSRWSATKVAPNGGAL